MRSKHLTRLAVALLGLVSIALVGNRCPGLNLQAVLELHQAGVDKYLGEFTPVASSDAGDGWTKHSFGPAAGDGPICIAGTAYSAYTRAGNPSKLLIFEQGGGACWQGFYNCNVLADDQAPDGTTTGI